MVIADLTITAIARCCSFIVKGSKVLLRHEWNVQSWVYARHVAGNIKLQQTNFFAYLVHFEVIYYICIKICSRTKLKSIQAVLANCIRSRFEKVAKHFVHDTDLKNLLFEL